MRQIKFRGKRVDNGEWEYGYYSCREGEHFIGRDMIVEGYATYEVELVIPETVGQFTGLKDKNGKEIYEGDIVSGIFNLRTGTRTEGSGRAKRSYSINEYILVHGIITFDEERASFYFTTEYKSKYMSNFWSGCGATKMQRKKNEWTESYDSPKNYLHNVNSKIEVIGNIHEHSHLLEVKS